MSVKTAQNWSTNTCKTAPKLNITENIEKWASKWQEVKKKIINVKVYGPLEQVQVHWSAGKADLAWSQNESWF